MTQLFDGITVLDFTRGMAGSIATMVMSDFGAEVIKVEPPGGDPFRHHPGAIQWNRGKKSVILDLKTAAGREQVQRLARQAGVIVESFRPGVTKRLGIDYETLGSNRPELVYCSLTGFGPKGPYANYKGYEGVVAAKSGRMMVFAGQNGREGPNYGAVPIASHSAAMALVRGAVAALYVRDRTGQGQMVETSLLQTITPYDLRDWIIWQMMIKFPEDFPEDPWLRRGASAPGYVPVRTKDGHWFQLANIVERLFRTMIHTLDLDHIYEDPRFKTAPVLLQEDRDALRDMILERVQEKTLDEWMDVFVNQTANVAAEPFTTAQDGMNHPQLLHNGQVVEVDDPGVGPMRQIGPLVAIGEYPGGPKGPAPVPGQHTQEILGLLGKDAKTSQTFPTGTLPKYPLEGITVLNLSTIIAGPLACCLVAELGARVIRIEPLEGENGRLNQMGIGVHRTMAGNEGLCLDLKTSEGQEIMHKLVAKADILLHSMRPGAPERLGIGYEQVAKINPQMIYVYAAGYGSTGPHSHRPAMHPISGAVCGGALAQLGRDTLPSPGESLSFDEVREISRKLNRANEPNPDPSSSMVHSAAMLLGLYARQRSGKGQYIESTMLMANAYANAEDFFQYEGKPPRRLPDAEGYGTGALNRLYPAKGGWVFLACPFEREWRDLCRTIERPDLLDDPRFAGAEDREGHDTALAGELERVFATREPLEWESLLTAADVACVKAEDRGPFHFFDEDAHVKANGFTTQVETPRLGKFWRYSPLLRFSHTQDKAEPGMLKGQHTEAILGELGYSREQVEGLKDRGVVDWEEA
ncbi:MAG: CoA transferase [Chloroflexi bacterium]|nr:CoA transferase [Chloroflexota bacterium]